jgi:hypothetical protein
LNPGKEDAMAVGYIEYKGKKILYEDYSNSTPETFSPLLQQASELIKKSPPNSVLALVNVTGTKFDTASSDKMKIFVKDNTPYIKVSAIFGLSGLQSVIYRAVVSFSGRQNLKVFNAENEAKDYLASL